MIHLRSLLALGIFAGSALLAGPTSAAAQVGGPCSLLSDDALSQAVGSPVHAMGLLANPTAAMQGGPAIADMCLAPLDADNGLMITHMVNVQAPGDASTMLASSQAGPAAAFAQLDASQLSTTQISGLGDAAVLLSGTSDGKQYGILVVWRGTDGYSLIGSGVADPQTSLSGVAQAILAGH